jgi:hypothetical protein
MMTLTPLRVSVSGPALPVLTRKVRTTTPLRRTVSLCVRMSTLLTMDGPTVKLVPPSSVTHLPTPVCTHAGLLTPCLPGNALSRGVDERYRAECAG